MRITKTEFVSCPSCGRTLFDLQSTTERIAARTRHLKGVKIAIMGCVVNGPGEMADADFGYVGGSPGRVNLYVGKEVVEKGVPEDGSRRAPGGPDSRPRQVGRASRIARFARIGGQGLGVGGRVPRSYERSELTPNP